MTKAFPTVCILCELRTSARPPRKSVHTSWQSARPIAQLQKKRPPRMILSPDVTKGPRTLAPRSQHPLKKKNNPFGGMNRRVAGVLPKLRQPPPKPPQSRKAVNKAKGRAERQPGDMKALKMQQSLSPVSYRQRNVIKTKLLEVDDFGRFDLLPVIRDAVVNEALKGLTVVRPTAIQRLAIPALLNRDSRSIGGIAAKMQQVLIAAETGSGKTLAYLLPTIDAIKRMEATEAEVGVGHEASVNAVRAQEQKPNVFELPSPPLSNETHSSAARPRAVILLPTSELVDQVGGVFKAFSHKVKFRAALISAAYSAKVIRNRLFGPSGVDVVLSTPYLLANLAESDPNILSRVQYLVVDEADSLLDRSFTPSTSAIIDKSTPSLKQLILCSATIPRSLDMYLQRRFPDIQRLFTPNLHAIPRRVQLGVVDIEKVPYHGNRNLACAHTIWNIGRSNGDEPGEDIRDVKRIIVFVNEREKATEVADYLLTKGIDAVALNRDTPEQRHGEILSIFTSRHPLSLNTALVASKGSILPQTQSNSHRVLPNTKVLVMTDIGSRGIDTIAVRDVILYDVPHTTIDFIHRLGRIGRMGRRGKGVVLVGNGDRKDVVREVREGMYRGQALI